MSNSNVPFTIVVCFFMMSVHVIGSCTVDNADTDRKHKTKTEQKQSANKLVDDVVAEAHLSHLRSPKEIGFLLLGDEFHIDDVSRIPVCNVKMPANVGDNSEAPGSIIISKRQKKSSPHNCSTENLKTFFKTLEPGFCAIFSTTLAIKKSFLSKPTFGAKSEKDSMKKGSRKKRTKSERIELKLYIESPIAINKYTHLEFQRTNWTAVSLCNRSNKPQPLKIKSHFHLPDDKNAIVEGLISRVDLAMPETIKDKRFFVGKSKKEDFILVRRIENHIVEKEILYQQTDRDLRRISKLLPPRYVNLKSLANKTVLDAGCGVGSFVLGLRSHNIEAYGLDLVIHDNLKDLGFFVEADMTNTKLKDSTFDVIYSVFTIFSNYYEGKDVALIQQALLEFYRLLKPNGEVRLVSVNKNSIEKSLEDIPGLTISEYGVSESKSYKSLKYMVLKKEPKKNRPLLF